MTDFLFSHSRELLGVLSLSSLISWILINHSQHKPKTIGLALVIALILFLPLFYQYEYVFPYSFHLLAVACISCSFFLISTLLEKFKVIKAIILTTLVSAVLLLSLVLSGIAFLEYIVEDKGPDKRTYKEYSDGKYMVIYHPKNNFDSYCELRKYAVIPVMTKHVENTAYYYENACEFSFDSSRLVYNSCENKLTSF